MTKRIYQPQISAQRIASRRKELNMTQKQLADKAFISLPTLKKYEGAQRVPDGDKRKSLAKALGVYEDWIIGEGPKDISEAIKKMCEVASKGNERRKNILKCFMAFIESLGYKFDTNNGILCISTTNGSKYANSDVMNTLIDEIISSTCKKLDAVKNDASLKDKYLEEPDSEIMEILLKDPTYQFMQKNKKEGDALGSE